MKIFQNIDFIIYSGNKSEIKNLLEKHNGKVHDEFKDGVKYFVLTEKELDIPVIKNSRSIWIDIEWLKWCLLSNEFLFPDKFLLKGECKILDSIDFNCNLEEIEGQIKE